MFIEILPRFWITNLINTEGDKFIEFYKISNIIDCHKDIKKNKNIDQYFIKLVKLIQSKICKLESIVLISKEKSNLYTIVLLYCMIFGKIPLKHLLKILSLKIDNFEITLHKKLLNLVNNKI